MNSRYTYRINLNRDKDGNPISVLQQPEQYVVLKGKIQLGQIPDKVYKVKIKDFNEIPDTDYSTEIGENNFRVDYSNGLVTFHESVEGKTVIVQEYYGKGIILFPYNRIWMEDDEFGNVTKTLNDYVDEANNLLNLVKNLDEAIDDGGQLHDMLDIENKEAITNIKEAKDVNTTLDDTTKNASNINTTLAETNQTAISTDTTLKFTNEIGSTLNTDLTNNITTGNELHTNLQEDIETGSTLKVNIDKNIEDGNELHTALTGDVSTATNKVEEIDSVVSVSKRLNVFEAYDNEKQYYPLNKVYYGGSSYICIKESKGILPSNAEYWGLIAQAGKGNVANVISSNSDIKVEEQSSQIKLTANTGTGANQILKLDEKGKVPSSTIDYKADKDYVNEELNNIKNSSITTEQGVHNIRFFNEKLEFYNGTEWIKIKTGGNGIAPDNVSNFNAFIGNIEIILTWNDPNDTVIDGQMLVTWDGTKIVRKVGDFPDDEKDGVLIIDNKVRNQYSIKGFVDTGLTNGVTYYYQAFPYSDQGTVNRNKLNRASASPESVATYGVKIDTTNSNPETAVTYTDDAIGIISGSTDWDSKFPYNQIKPCMFKDGKVNYYLDPNNYTKKADGTDSDVASGNDGDVMIEIPKIAYYMYQESNYQNIKIANKNINDKFCYYAHTRDIEGDRDKLYIGAYLGFLDSDGKLRSLSDKVPTTNKNLSTFRTAAQKNGTGYDLLSFYPLTLIQCLYVNRYKNLNSQEALGKGYAYGNSSLTITGGTNTKGMYFGEDNGNQQMKFIGIEDFWGNCYQWIDGLYIDSNRNMFTAFKKFNDTGNEYLNRGVASSADMGNNSTNYWMSNIQGKNETGFIPKIRDGSRTTYYTDYVTLYASRFTIFGGAKTSGDSAGAFSMACQNKATSTADYLGARLMYL